MCKYKTLTIKLLIAFSLYFQACSTNTAKEGQDDDKNNLPQTNLHITDTSRIPKDKFGEMVRYGRDLIVNTAYYIGPEGTKGRYLGNKMNCSNCHLDAGTRLYGLNFLSTHARYPQYRGRENKVLSLAERINNCIERPHNGKGMPLDSKEIVAIISYMKWLATNVPTGQHIDGDSGIELQYPNRPASTEKGAVVYATHCSSCHGKDGQGTLRIDASTYIYPPLWGTQSYAKGSSPFRVLMLARFIKANMPDKIATWNNPLLTDEEAIDVAAFINDDKIHARPQAQTNGNIDYAAFEVKPIDYSEGPYADTFSALQHKFGPYLPIIEYHQKHQLPTIF